MAQLHAQKEITDSLHIYHSIEEALSEPEKVQTLEVIHLQDGDRLELLRKFPNLTSLSLIDFQSAEAPESISKLKGLKELKFINDDFRTLPDSYENLVNLEHLEFVYDTHLNLQNAMRLAGKLPALKELRIEGLPGLVISDQIEFPAHLRILSLRNNHLNHLPLGIVNLKDLEILDVGNNEFLDLPEFVADLPKLNTIYLDQQPFLKFDSTIDVLRKNPSLMEVHLEGNHLTREAIKPLGMDARFSMLLDEDHKAKSLMYSPHINDNLPPMPHEFHAPENASFKIPLKRKK
jgi:Leucine-rich repeat (LRR) protein